MRKSLAKIGPSILLAFMLLTSSVPIGYAAPEGATVTFEYDSAKKELQVTIDSPVGIGEAEIQIEMPDGVDVTSFDASGFMEDARQEEDTTDTTKAWLRMDANGEKQGSLKVKIKIAPAADSKGEVVLKNIWLYDKQGEDVPIETSLPIPVQLGNGPPPQNGDKNGDGNGPNPVEGAKVEFAFNDQTGQLSVKIDSPSGISQGNIKLHIPDNVGMKKPKLSGFMEGAAYMPMGSVHQWLRMAANGVKNGSLVADIKMPDNKVYKLTLLEVNLLDRNGKNVPIDTPLPLSLEITDGGKDGGVGLELGKLLVLLLGILGVGLLAMMLMTRGKAGRIARRR